MANVIKASKFIKLPNEYREMFLNEGVIPVNDIYFPHFGNREKIVLPHGGYGSGKSKWVAQDLVEKCRTDKYFKCFYGRKIKDTVRTSNFDELATEIEKRGLEDEFQYSRADNSSMVITHRKTGNKFIPFGGDNPKSLKSIKDATHIWCEEFDQFTEVDFGFLFSRLRTEDADLQFYGTFNSEPLIEGHWLRDQFFNDKNTSEIKPLKIFSVYRDNHFINQQDYYDKLKLIAKGRDHILNAIAEGWFGITVNDNPFFYANKQSQFTNDILELNKSLPLDVGFDFNANPCCAVVGQHNPAEYSFKIFDVLTADVNTTIGKSPLQALCMAIKEKYITSGLFVPYRIRVTGDASGSNANADTANKLAYYFTIMRELGVYEAQIFKRAANTMHEFSGKVINELLYKIEDGKFLINKIELHNDINKAYKDEKNSLNKAKAELGLHILDAWRYLMDFWLCYLNGGYTNDFKRITANIDNNIKRTKK